MYHGSFKVTMQFKALEFCWETMCVFGTYCTKYLNTVADNGHMISFAIAHKCKFPGFTVNHSMEAVHNFF